MMNFKKIMLLAVAATGMATTANAQEAMTIDQKVNDIFANVTGPFVNFIFAPLPGTAFPWIVMWLVIAASVFTLYFGFVQFRFFGHAIGLVKGDYSDPNDAGEVSHFQALATALSGTVGLGNIAGVAVAVGIGGPGATFWMILAGLLGMASKFTECTLGVKYRNEYEDGTVSGGPMYYISKGFKELGLPGGKFLAIMFSIFCILGALWWRQHVPGQPGTCADFGNCRRIPGLDHRTCVRGDRVRGDCRRHQVDCKRDREDRAVHGHSLCRRGIGHPACKL
jgi:AGCS family alanine or glycine:cation symporter